MVKNLVIVESPAKAKTIEKVLGSDYLVKSSFGHVRDLSKTKLSIDLNKGFTPNYEVLSDKKKIVGELKKLSDAAATVWLATDEDREGEAISWHLSEVLQLDPLKTKRIVFHEITKPAIIKAIENPRSINLALVDAQQARRVLDRLVGYEISPILWRKVKPALSAGRVQSVAVRLIVEREEEIRNFVSVATYRITAHFSSRNKTEKTIFQAELPERYKTKEEAFDFLKRCIGAVFSVSGIETKPGKKSPAPPFTTSTLQQEASRKLGFSVAKTMLVAQQLYESGKITYMRTDSVNLSETAIAQAKEEIENLFGKAYLQTRRFTTKTKGAQEAHEAIRPTYSSSREIAGDISQRRLYELIWKRTIASQMSDAVLEKTTVSIAISTTPEILEAKGEVVIFDGFLKVYFESNDDDPNENPDGVLPLISKGDKLTLHNMTATQRFSQRPYRYSEASLVKKLEELGIGRPSTYAPTISTIQRREYVEKGNKPAMERNFFQLELKNDEISEQEKTEAFGSEKERLFPTDIGQLVNQFLTAHFPDILDYHFTAGVEKNFDEIAQGKQHWSNMIEAFYNPFHNQVKEVLEKSEKVKGERLLGKDPESGLNVYVKIGRYGVIAQKGDGENDQKPLFAGLRKNQSLETITLQEALELFKFPRTIGLFEGKELIVAVGRFGPYVKHGSDFFSLGKTDDPSLIDEARAIEIIEEKRIKNAEKIIRGFAGRTDVKVLKGRWGAYLTIGGNNYRIPKTMDPALLTLDECLAIAAQKPEPKQNTKKRSSNKRAK